MQELGVWSGGNIISVCNHLSKDIYVHEIYINHNSKLYNILNKDIIKVNSRHKDSIQNPNLKVAATDINGVIEVIEDSNKKFFMGVQFHPESLINDENSKKIFASFIEASRGNNY